MRRIAAKPSAAKKPAKAAMLSPAQTAMARVVRPQASASQATAGRPRTLVQSVTATSNPTWAASRPLPLSHTGQNGR